MRAICFLMLFNIGSVALFAEDWDPEDKTFDPNRKSVVIGNRSWIGDPSPFLHVGLSRTGYTHVHVAQYGDADPTVSLSLMVPIEVGEKQPPTGGFMMFSPKQAAEFIKLLDAMVTTGEKKAVKPAKVTTSLDTEWTLSLKPGEKGKRVVLMESKTKEKTEGFRFSVNACKKLIGALKHSLKRVEATAAE